MNECIRETSVHLSWSLLKQKTLFFTITPSLFPLAWTRLQLLSPSCEFEGPPVYITSPMTHTLTSTLKMEAACSPET